MVTIVSAEVLLIVTVGERYEIDRSRKDVPVYPRSSMELLDSIVLIYIAQFQSWMFIHTKEDFGVRNGAGTTNNYICFC